MKQTKHVFPCTILPLEPEYVIACKREVHHLDAGSGQESIHFIWFRDHFGHCPIILLSQFPKHGFETEFGQTPFGSIIPDRFLL